MGFANKRIAVVGGGLGGMAFVNAALYAGLENIQLYEQAPEFTEVGAGVNITKNANVILDAYGLKDAMRWKSSHDPPCYMEYRNYKTGEVFGQIDEFGQPSSRQIHRAHLLEVMRERVPASILNTGKRLTSIHRSETGEYVLVFLDGSEAMTDIIIGCDGIKSAVRAHLGFADQPNYSGQMVYRGYVQYEDISEKAAKELRKTVIFRGKQRHILTLPIGNDHSKTARVGLIGFMTEPLESWVSESWMAKAPVDRLAEQVEGWTETVQEIITGLRKGAERGSEGDMILKQALYVRDPIPKWYQVEASYPGTGIILLGDSAHSTLPHQGQGACMAIESGVALATILKNWKSNNLEAAFEFYQGIRKPRTDKVTRTSYEAGKLASADIPEVTSENFNPDALRERMKWIMDYDVLNEVYEKGAPHFEAAQGPIEAHL